MGEDIKPENYRLKGITTVSPNRYDKRKGAKPSAVDFVPQEFDRLLEDQGTRVRVTPSILCPNQSDLYTENHKLDCPLCFGSRVIDLCNEAQESWASFTNIDLKIDTQLQGIMDVKDSRVTFQAGVRVYYQYKVEVLDFASIFNQMIMATANNYVRLRYNPIIAIDTPFYLVDSAGKSYCVDKDYQYIPGENKLVWKTANRPAAGTVFSISYPMLPTFRVVEMLHENRYYYVGFKQKQKKPIQLPQQALVRWDYMFNQTRSVPE